MIRFRLRCLRIDSSLSSSAMHFEPGDTNAGRDVDHHLLVPTRIGYLGEEVSALVTIVTIEKAARSGLQSAIAKSSSTRTSIRDSLTKNWPILPSAVQ